MSNFRDEDASKLLAEFWDHLAAAGLVVDDALKMQRQLQVRQFLIERREKREAGESGTTA